MSDLKPPYPLELETIRACPYCSFRDQCNGVMFQIHLANHTEKEKTLLQSGDITRLISLVEKELREMKDRDKEYCCDFDTCLHNYSGGRDVRLTIIKKKLEQYIDDESVITVTAIPFTQTTKGNDE